MDGDGLGAVHEEDLPVHGLRHGGNGVGGTVLGPQRVARPVGEAEVLDHGPVLREEGLPVVVGPVEHRGRGQSFRARIGREKRPVACGDAAVVHLSSFTHVPCGGEPVLLEHAGVDGGGKPLGLRPLPQRARGSALPAGTEQAEGEMMRIDAQYADGGIGGHAGARL